jgi:hypothetical protein
VKNKGTKRDVLAKYLTPLMSSVYVLKFHKDSPINKI